MNFLSNVLREDGGFEYKKAIVDSILILIKDIPDAKEPGLGHLCEFIEASPMHMPHQCHMYSTLCIACPRQRAVSCLLSRSSSKLAISELMAACMVLLEGSTVDAAYEAQLMLPSKLEPELKEYSIAGLRVHVPQHPDPAPAGCGGAENEGARQVHPLHLQPHHPRERDRARRSRLLPRQVWRAG